MGDRLFFEIPEDPEVMVILVRAVPSNWSWVDGGLYAPQDSIVSGAAKEDTGFAVKRFFSIRPTIVGGYSKKGKRSKPDLFAIMVKQKLPGFVHFEEAGFDKDEVTLETAKQIAVGFLKKGYRGCLCFYKDYYNNSKYNNPAYCDMTLEPWHGTGEEVGLQPARMKLEWDDRYSGKEEDIATIVTVCYSLGLRKYVPAPAAAH